MKTLNILRLASVMIKPITHMWGKATFPMIVLMFFLMLLGSCKSTQIHYVDFENNPWQDGIWMGHAKNINEAHVQVTINSQIITDLQLVSLEATPIGKRAQDTIPARILQMQTPYVDAVSGATEASRTIINATVDALKKSAAIQ